MVVGVVRPHLLDTREDAPYRLDVPLRGRPAPFSLFLRPALPLLPPRPQGPTLLFPPLSLGPLPAPSPWLGRTPSPLLSGLCRGSRPLSPAPLRVPLTLVSLPCPSPCPWLCPCPLPAPRCCWPWRPARVLVSVPWPCCSCPRPSRALAHALRCALCPSVQYPRSGLPRVPHLPCCRWPWCPARVLALSPYRVRSGPSPSSVPARSPCRLPSLAQRSRARLPAPPVRRLTLPGSHTWRVAAASAAAA